MDLDPSQLKHWSRVALAAESAAIVKPLFDEAWPHASEEHRSAVSRAIELATRSAAQQQACAGLEEAISDAGQAAGYAQFPHIVPVELEDGEIPPAGPKEAGIASLAAKAAQLAAQAAFDESKSEKGREGFYFALDAAHFAGRDDLMMRIWAAASDWIVRDRPWWKFW